MPASTSASHESLEQYDLVVIGSGPAGEGAAMKAAKSGKSVAVVERYIDVGGGSTHWGTIPSKALRQAIHHAVITFDNPLYRRLDLVRQFSLPDLLASAASVIDQQSSLRRNFYDQNHVRLLPGHARFADPHTVVVERNDGGRVRLSAEAFVIATGSRPYRPPDVDFSHPRILDSDTLLQMAFTPRSVTIYGAGVVGCEYASMLRNMRLDVNLVNTRDKLLAFLDDEIVDALSYHFADRGIRIMHGEEYDRVEPDDTGVTISLESGKRLRSEAFLFCNGRSGNSRDLGLEPLGIEPDSRGYIAVNDCFQTAHPHIYAAGDIVGFPSLASASYDQGRFAGTHFAEGRAAYKLVREIPSGIYTNPEISSLGKTEAQLTRERIPYEVGKAKFKTLARAQITGQTVGMLKILFHRESLEILGLHCFGGSAAEIIHIGQAVMAQPPPNNTIRYFVETTFNYPTMAEAYRVAALSGLDRLA